jgi:tetratricopeptide (TPR) repeat protein
MSWVADLLGQSSDQDRWQALLMIRLATPDSQRCRSPAVLRPKGTADILPLRVRGVPHSPDRMGTTLQPYRRSAPTRPVGLTAMALAAATLAACGRTVPTVLDQPAPPTPRPEALSLLNRPLYQVHIPLEQRTALQLQLDSAAQRYIADPDDADAVIWLGRRLAYLGRYRDAISVFSAALEKHPGDARILRHRGHRYLTTRQLDLAIADLQRAAALVEGRPDSIEPDGQPNPSNIPTSTLQGNIYYHLALAHYLRRDFARAADAWEHALARATTDDMRVAVSDWLYLTYRRLGRAGEAERLLRSLDRELEIFENHAYERRLRLYRGTLPPDSLLPARGLDPVQVATYGYGMGAWYLLRGDTARAEELFRRVLRGTNWAAFGFIAAEAEIASRRARS